MYIENSPEERECLSSMCARVCTWIRLRRISLASFVPSFLPSFLSSILDSLLLYLFCRLPISLLFPVLIQLRALSPRASRARASFGQRDAAKTAPSPSNSRVSPLYFRSIKSRTDRSTDGKRAKRKKRQRETTRMILIEWD